MIYFIRHGETDYNKKHIMQGWLDIPLNERGLSQAEEAKQNCKELKIDFIFSSPLLRAKQTAEKINEIYNLPIVFDDRLKEIYGGSLQGECRDDWSEEKSKDAYAHPEKYGAETLPQLYNRVVDFFKEIENSDKNILIVSHGGVYRSLYKYLNNIDSFDFEIEGLKNATLKQLK